MEQAQQQLDDNISTGFATPPLPSTASEFITALAHFHRAEIARMAGWRDRIDRTSNWAITGVAAMLSLSLSSPSSSHGVLLFAMIMILLLLLIEARRYRFFDVYRGRVRIIERNYFAQMFAPDSQVKEDWAKALGKERWAGAVDSVGSTTLANVLSQMQYYGAVAACGLAQGADLPTSVMPLAARRRKSTVCPPCAPLTAIVTCSVLALSGSASHWPRTPSHQTKSSPR